LKPFDDFDVFSGVCRPLNEIVDILLKFVEFIGMVRAFDENLDAVLERREVFRVLNWP
jgi:hypothetical protein